MMIKRCNYTSFILFVVLICINPRCKQDTAKAPQKDRIEKRHESSAHSSEYEFTIPSLGKTSTPQEFQKSIEPIIQSIDENLSSYDPVKRNVTNEYETEYGIETVTNPIIIWYNSSSEPVKIQKSVRDDSGAVFGASNYYFHKGKIWFIDEAYAKYVFFDSKDLKANKLQYWLNESWENNSDIPDEDFKARNNSIVKSMEKMLDTDHPPIK